MHAPWAEFSQTSRTSATGGDGLKWSAVWPISSAVTGQCVEHLTLGSRVPRTLSLEVPQHFLQAPVGIALVKRLP